MTPMSDTSAPSLEELSARVAELTEALLALGRLEFVGDVPGHPFHGNQWTAGGGGPGKSSLDNPSINSNANAAATAAQAAAATRDPNVRGPKAEKVYLSNFDGDTTKSGPQLPTAESLKTGQTTDFIGQEDYRFAHGSLPRGYGSWIFEHESGARISANGTFTDAKAGIKEQFPKSGDWGILT
jgi:hypothetical protein